MSNQNLQRRYTEMSAHLVAFCRYLREKDYNIGAKEEAEALEAIALIQAFEDPDQFQLCLQTVLAKSLRQQIDFAEHYNTYWNEISKAVDSKIKKSKEQKNDKPSGKSQQQQAPSLQELKHWLYGNAQKDTEELASYSAGAIAERKDFSGFSEAGLKELEKLIHLLANTLANRYSRRFKKSKSSAQIDFRKTMRQNMRRGGEILHLAFRKKQKQKLRLVLLCDVSKSMDLYSRFLIQFLYAFQNNYRQVETFVFSTSLHRITHDLQKGEFKDILQQLSDTIPGWSGGTQIGNSLHTFVKDYAGKMLDHRSIVLIMSDGWDTGDIDVLEESMRKIYRKSGRVIWLNPLAGNPNYQPSVKGMEVALPFVDVFAPAHSVESLKEMIKQLKGRKKTKKWL